MTKNTGNILALDSTLDLPVDFAIIGAGMSGLSLAKALKEQGYDVAVFEKARGTGGRLSSKRITTDPQSFMAFDLGCTSITAQTTEFAQQLKQFQEAGIVSPWWQEQSVLGDGQVHYVGIPRNSALTRHLSNGIECHFSTHIHALEQNLSDQGDHIWQLLSAPNENKVTNNPPAVIAKAKHVILATPPAQAYELLPNTINLKKPLESVAVAPQWVMGIEVEDIPLELPELSIVTSEVLYSISRESLKPERESSINNILQVQATSEWTNNHLDLTQEQVSHRLTEALVQYLRDTFDHQLRVVHSYSHRWLYSRTVNKILAQEGYLFDDTGLGLVGDYFDQSYDGITGEIAGVESAWLSAQKLAQFLSTRVNKTANKCV